MNWMMNFTHGDLPNQQKTKGLRIPSIKNINICLDRLATPFLSPFIISDTKSTKAIAGQPRFYHFPENRATLTTLQLYEPNTPKRLQGSAVIPLSSRTTSPQVFRRRRARFSETFASVLAHSWYGRRRASPVVQAARRAHGLDERWRFEFTAAARSSTRSSRSACIRAPRGFQAKSRDFAATTAGKYGIFVRNLVGHVLDNVPPVKLISPQFFPIKNAKTVSVSDTT